MIASEHQPDPRRVSLFRQVVAQPVLRRLLPAMALSALGDGMSAVAVAWLALRLAGEGHRGYAVGAAVAAYTLPGAVGAIVLTKPLRRRSGAQLLAADAALRAVALAAIPILYAFGLLKLPSYVALLAASSVLHGWGISGRYTMVAEHLPEELQRTGNALLSTFDMSSLIVGPLLVGLIVAVADPSVAIAADAASFAVLALVAGSLAGTRTDRTAADEAADEPEHPHGHGFRVISSTPALAGLLALTWLYFFLYGPVEVALPLYVVDSLHGSAGLFGLFWAVFGIGAVTGTVVAGTLRRLPLWPTLLLAVIGWGAALLPLGLLDSVPVVLASFAIGGLVFGPYNALSASIFQKQSPRADLSQVLAARGALTVLAAPLGAALGGPLVARLGAAHTFLASGVATIVVGVAAVIVIGVRKNRPAADSVSR
ncbi:MAG: MFS transporter [Actinomycetota bacterium]